MNQIFEKSRTKRKYHKTPPCGHTDGYCDMEHCRMQYAIKEPKGKLPPLDKTFKHRDKVVKTIRRKQLQKLDSEIDDGLCACNTCECYPVQGEYGKRKIEIKRYKRMFWMVVAIFIALPILYVLAIMVIDLIN